MAMNGTYLNNKHDTPYDQPNYQYFDWYYNINGHDTMYSNVCYGVVIELQSPAWSSLRKLMVSYGIAGGHNIYNYTINIMHRHVNGHDNSIL